MNRMIKKMLAAAVLAVVALTAGSRDAQAGMMLQLSDGVGDSGVIVSGTNLITFSGTVGRYDITLTAGAANVPGTAINGRLEITNLSISLNTAQSVGDIRTLSINLSASDYSLPSGSPLSLDSSGTVTFTESTAGSDSWSFKSWLDGTNSGAFQAGVATPGVSIVSPGGNPGSLAANDTSVLVDRGPLYSLSSLTTITLVSTNSTANTTGASVTNAVPAPAALVMALTGLPVFGVGAWVRRRRAAVA